MTEIGETNGDAAPRRRRRRPNKSRPEHVSLIDRIKDKRFGHFVFAAMTVLAAAYTLSSYRQVNHAAGQYGGVVLGRPVDELARQFGNPASDARQSGTVRYLNDGRVMEVAFDPATRAITGVLCREQKLTARACPKHLGIGLGSHRDVVRQAFGPEAAGPGTGPEVLDFPNVGTTIELTGEAVSAIGLSGQRRTGNLWPVVLWRMLP